MSKSGGQEKLDVGRTIRRAIDVLRRNWRPLLPPTLVLVCLPAALASALEAGGATAAQAVVSLLALIPYAIWQVALIRLTAADLRAEALSTNEALAVGRRRLWALLGLGFLSGLGIALGFLLLIVPGVLLALAWSVTAPVLVEERRPILETFGRSAELTRGSRLNILGLGLLFTAATIVALLALALVSVPFPESVGAVLIAPLYGAAVFVATTTLVTTVYEELRALEAERPAEAASPQS